MNPYNNIPFPDTDLLIPKRGTRSFPLWVAVTDSASIEAFERLEASLVKTGKKSQKAAEEGPRSQSSFAFALPVGIPWMFLGTVTFTADWSVLPTWKGDRDRKERELKYWMEDS